MIRTQGKASNLEIIWWSLAEEHRFKCSYVFYFITFHWCFETITSTYSMGRIIIQKFTNYVASSNAQNISINMLLTSLAELIQNKNIKTAMLFIQKMHHYVDNICAQKWLGPVNQRRSIFNRSARQEVSFCAEEWKEKRKQTRWREEEENQTTPLP